MTPFSLGITLTAASFVGCAYALWATTQNLREIDRLARRAEDLSREIGYLDGIADAEKAVAFGPGCVKTRARMYLRLRRLRRNSSGKPR